MTPAEILRRAADLIEPEGAWTTAYLARDRKGQRQFPLSPLATCWCAIGALMKAAGSESPPDYDAAEDALEKHIGRPVGRWNDSHKQAEVVSALRQAADSVGG